MDQGKRPIVLVTGATGFIAHHIIQLLLREGYRIRGTVRNLKNENKLKSLRNLFPDAEYPIELVEADLTKDIGWGEAVKGCDYCIHVASPVPTVLPENEDDLIFPAVEGTKRVLKACSESGTIKRVVLTSSTSALEKLTRENLRDESRVFTEEDWTDPSTPYNHAYTKSKTLAEKAAWEFVRNLPPETKMELAVVNPSVVLGPCLNGVLSTSLECVKRLMDWSVLLIPQVHVPLCDARDVALAHLRAMTLPEAANNRHIVNSTTLWWKDIAKILRKEFSSYGYFIPRFQAPYIFVYIFSFFDKATKLLLPRYGIMYSYSNHRMKDVLKLEPREAEEILIDTARSLIDSGILRKTRRYKNGKDGSSKLSSFSINHFISQHAKVAKLCFAGADIPSTVGLKVVFISRQLEGVVTERDPYSRTTAHAQIGQKTLRKSALCFK